MSMTGSTTNGPTERRSPGTVDGLGGDLAIAALALARRFSAGATMWCVGPVWTEHARHVAVEFVHPVIVGKRALPALTVDSADPVAALRPMAASGDVLVLVGDAATPGRPRPAAQGRRVGADDRMVRRRRASSGRVGRPRAVGRRRRRSPSRRIRRPPLPPAVGADPRLLRACRRADAAGRRSWRGVPDVLRRGPPGRGAVRRRPGHGRGAHVGRRRDGSTRRSSRRSARGTSC